MGSSLPDAKLRILSQNAMSVTECCIGTRKMNPEAARNFVMERRQSGADNSSPVDQLRAVAGLCNSGEFDASSSNVPLAERKIKIGNATDQAILRFSEGLGPVSELQHAWKKHFEVAFNSKNKFLLRTLSNVQPEGLTAALSAKEIHVWSESDL